MSRLIDADMLLEHWHISEKCEECHWNNRDCSKPPYYSLHDICEGIDEVPTIDAIPVGWLRKYTAVGATPRGDRLTEGNERLIIYRILNDWQKEQEARW